MSVPSLSSLPPLYYSAYLQLATDRYATFFRQRLFTEPAFEFGMGADMTFHVPLVEMRFHTISSSPETVPAGGDDVKVACGDPTCGHTGGEGNLTLFRFNYQGIQYRHHPHNTQGAQKHEGTEDLTGACCFGRYTFNC